MVKRPRIASTIKKTSTPTPDQWVTGGGIDPEIKAISIEEKPSSDEKNKTYPHRISFDMETGQYKRLKWASFKSERPMNELLREAIEDWLSKNNY